MITVLKGRVAYPGVVHHKRAPRWLVHLLMLELELHQGRRFHCLLWHNPWCYKFLWSRNRGVKQIIIIIIDIWCCWFDETPAWYDVQLLDGCAVTLVWWFFVSKVGKCNGRLEPHGGRLQHLTHPAWCSSLGAAIICNNNTSQNIVKLMQHVLPYMAHRINDVDWCSNHLAQSLIFSHLQLNL